MFSLTRTIGLQKESATIFGEEQQLATPKEEKKQMNNQTKAIVMINLYGIAVTCQSAFYKLMHDNGIVSIMEYTLFRDLIILGFAGFLLWK